MSEAERLRRQEYKRNRKKWIFIQTFALVLLFAIACFAVYDRMNRTYYIEYAESGTVDYKVQLKDNDFFDEDFVEKDRSYVASLIKNITTDFNYALSMDAASVGVDYSYKIDAQLAVSNNETGDYIYAPTYELIPLTRKTAEETGNIKISESIDIDFEKYKSIATSFIDVYDLSNVNSMLAVTMTVDVISSCNEFESNNSNSYFITLNIPLAVENFSIYSTSSTPNAESKVLACSGAANQKILLGVGVGASALSLLASVGLVAFVCLTRNEDINYTNKVRKLFYKKPLRK